MRYLRVVHRALLYIVRSGFVWSLVWASAGVAVYGVLGLASTFFVATGAPPIGFVGDPLGSIVLGASLGAFYGVFAGVLFGVLNCPLLFIRALRHRGATGAVLGVLSGAAIAVASANGIRLDTGTWPSDFGSMLAVAAVLGSIAGLFTVHGRSQPHLRDRGRTVA